MISSNLTFFFTDIVTIEDLTETSKITGFDNCDSDEYLKNVKRALCNFREEFNYDSANVTLQKMTSMFDRYGGENSKCCIPRIDAIGLLLRRHRVIFDQKRFFEIFPSMKGQLLYCQKLLEL